MNEARSIVLGIETATFLGGVALVGREGVLAERMLDVRATYAERLLPALEALLQETGKGVEDLTRIAVSLGPGSFTGLRIGLATAQGLAVASGCPLAGIGTLEALAWNLAGNPGPVVAILDARRGEVYGAAYRVDGDLPVELIPPQAKSPDDFMQDVRSIAEREAREGEDGIVLAGPGSDLLLRTAGSRSVAGESPRIRRAPLHLDFPRPSALADLALRRGCGVERAPEELAPVYLRPPATRRKP